MLVISIKEVRVSTGEKGVVIGENDMGNEGDELVNNQGVNIGVNESEVSNNQNSPQKDVNIVNNYETNTVNDDVGIDNELVNKSESSGGMNVNEKEQSSDLKAKKNSYANIVKQDVFKLQTKLITVPTKITEDGCEIVVFDEELVKLLNVPMEERSVEGISAIASSLGKPIIMNNMTANKIEIQYGDKGNNKKGTKEVTVEYAWKPGCCKECKVFGHEFKNFNKRTKTSEELKEIRVEIEKANEKAKEKERNMWNVKNGGIEQMRKSANKYSVLETLEDDERREMNLLKDRMVVDQYLNNKIKPDNKVISTWASDMVNYFKTQWEIHRLKEKEDEVVEIEEVLEEYTEAGRMLAADEIHGKEKAVLN
uniref:Uncharacterized protein n=1 Tax=Tanacetum cinerariifolium TaxID=118510 RepID=A0A6L2J0M5_TANCI|nr:hypothetical protein [Tanacetum cinerariifolium]